MRNYLLTLMLLLNACFAQQLVVNPGFQTTFGQPTDSGQAWRAFPYWGHAGTPDLFTAGSPTPNYQIPCNIWGCQPNLPGQANYFGLRLLDRTEAIAGRFSQNLGTDEIYTVMVWFRLAGNSTAALIDPIQFGLYDSPPDTSTDAIIAGLGQTVHLDEQGITDDSLWVIARGSFRAISPDYSNFIFGNWKDRKTLEYTDLAPNNPNKVAYYYVERIEVRKSSSLPVSITPEPKEDPAPYPNPASTFIRFGPGPVDLFTMSGAHVGSRDGENAYIGDLAPGVYLYRRGTTWGRFVRH